MNAKKNLLFTIIALILFFAGFFVGSFGAVDTKPPMSTDVASAPESVANAFTELLTLCEYTKSGAVLAQRGRLPSELIGRDEAFAAEYFSDWSILGFTPELIVRSRTIDSYDPQTFELSLHEAESGVVLAVFGYDELGERMLIRQLDLPAALYDSATRAQLASGIFVRGEGELSELLTHYEEW